MNPPTIRQVVYASLVQCLGSEAEPDDADTVIKAIDASGRVTVDRARFERLIDAANMAADEWGAESRVGLQPGDLEPLP